MSIYHVTKDSNSKLSLVVPTSDLPSTTLWIDPSSLLSKQTTSRQHRSERRISKLFSWSAFIFLVNFVSSVLVISLSKWIYIKHNFPNLTLTTINFFISFILLVICLKVKVFQYVRLPILNMIPVSICFAGFIAFSNLSLQYNTVGTYQLIKLQVTPAVMLISWLFFKARYPIPIVLSFVPVLVGTLVITFYDLQYNLFGLICALISVSFTSVYQILVEHYQKVYKCNALQLLFYQAPLSGFLLVFVIPFLEPLTDLKRVITHDTVILVLLCGVLAFFVNFSIFWVIGNLSAVAYNMIGHSKTLLIILFGSIIFHESLNQQQVLGLLFTMFGVFMYSYFKYVKK